MRASAWQRIIESAERHNDPGRFTALIGYEYTRGVGGRHVHRNVIFRGGQAPELPFSSLDGDPEDLWNWLDGLREDGIEALAMPHNMNQSDGLAFPDRETWKGAEIDAEFAAKRIRNEPVAEISQQKGTSEVHPSLSPNDEWADFQIVQYYLDRVNNTDPISIFKGGYWRDALLTGLEMEERLGVNPYALGAVGSSDSHVSAGSYEEDNRFSSRTNTPQARGSAYSEEDGGWENFWTPRQATHGTGGLAGVWAAGNTRAAIFDALKRRESFATSGTRIRVRFFGGFGLDEAIAAAGDQVAAAYEAGVPMGGDLGAAEGRTLGAPAPSPASGNEVAPSFLVWALRDPENAWLQRAQVIKGWLEDGEAKERVYDVVCSDGLEPDPETHRCDDKRRPGQPGRLLDQPGQGRRRTPDHLDRPGLRRRRQLVLLRPRAREPDLPLVDLGRAQPRYRAEPRSPRHPPGTGVEFPDLVHAVAIRWQLRLLPPSRPAPA